MLARREEGRMEGKVGGREKVRLCAAGNEGRKILRVVFAAFSGGQPCQPLRRNSGAGKNPVWALPSQIGGDKHDDPAH